MATAIDAAFTRRFRQAAQGFEDAVSLRDPEKISYHLGIAVGMMLTVLPQEDADELMDLQSDESLTTRKRAELVFDFGFKLFEG